MQDQFGELYDRTQSQLSNYIVDPSAVEAIRPWYPNYKSDRMVAQQGHFTFCFQILGDQERLIEDVCSAIHQERIQEAYWKVIIPKN